MTAPYRIITVCTGNICRSPMAELMLAQAVRAEGLNAVIDSAGTTPWEVGNPIDRRAARKLAEHGIASEGHVARQFQPEWFGQRDLILAMDVDHYEHLCALAPDDDARAKVRMFRSFDVTAFGEPLEALGIYDPWYGDMADFEATWHFIQTSIPGILSHAVK